MRLLTVHQLLEIRDNIKKAVLLLVFSLVLLNIFNSPTVLANRSKTNSNSNKNSLQDLKGLKINIKKIEKKEEPLPYKKFTFIITDDRNKRPVENAIVWINNRIKSTSENGTVSFLFATDRKFVVKATKNGFEKTSRQVAVDIPEVGPTVQGIAGFQISPVWLDANYSVIYHNIGVTLSGKIMPWASRKKSKLTKKIRMAHGKDKKVWLLLIPYWHDPDTGRWHNWGGKGEFEMGPVPNQGDFLSRLENTVRSFSLLADSLEVEMLSPTCDLQVFVSWKNKVRWHNKMAPKTRNVYDGLLIPKNEIGWEKWNLENRGNLSYYRYFKNYDYVSADIFRAGAYQGWGKKRTLQNFRNYVENTVQTLKRLKRKYNARGIILGPEIGPKAVELKETYPNKTVEEILNEQVKIIFETSLGEVDGYSFWSGALTKESQSRRLNTKNSAVRKIKVCYTGRKSLEVENEKVYNLILNARENLEELDNGFRLWKQADSFLGLAIREYNQKDFTAARRWAYRSLSLTKILRCEESLLSRINLWIENKTRENLNRFSEILEKSWRDYKEEKFKLALEISNRIWDNLKFNIDGGEKDWKEIKPVVKDRKGDSELEKQDIGPMYIFRNDKNLYLMAKTWHNKINIEKDFTGISTGLTSGKISNPQHYHADFRMLFRLSNQGKAALDFVSVAYENVFEIKIPLDNVKLPLRKLVLSFRKQQGRKILDDVDIDRKWLKSYNQYPSLMRTLRVIKPTKIRAENLEVRPSTAQLGEQVNISATITSSGGMKKIRDVIFRIENKTVCKKTIILNPNVRDFRKIVFKVSKEKVGNYNFSIDNITSSFKVVKLAEEEKGGGLPLTWIGIGIIMLVIAGLAMQRKS